jgi:hypothetical protein
MVIGRYTCEVISMLLLLNIQASRPDLQIDEFRPIVESNKNILHHIRVKSTFATRVAKWCAVTPCYKSSDPKEAPQALFLAFCASCT